MKKAVYLFLVFVLLSVPAFAAEDIKLPAPEKSGTAGSCF